MSFIVRKTKHRAWPVTVNQPACSDAGEVTETKATFVAHFAPFTEAEIEAAIAQAKKDHPAPKVKVPPFDGIVEKTGEFVEEEGPVPMSLSLVRNAQVFSRVVVGWGSEVKDEAGQSIPFSVDVLKELVTGPDGVLVSGAFNRALFELRYGIAREKNSSASPAPGGDSAPAEAVTNSPATLPSSE